VPSKEEIAAFDHVLKSAIDLCRILGPVKSTIIAAVACAALILLYHVRATHLSHGWRCALDAKDETIRLINEQNRELRVQNIVVGGQLTQEQAVRLVYRNHPVDLDADTEPAKKGEKR
jgi:hypothetical protein